MTKKNKNALKVFTEGIGLYFSNFSKFIKYMAFPVFGQIAGLIVICFTTSIYTSKLPVLLERFSNLNDIRSLIILSILVTLPGLAIFTKAFWEYLIAYGAINSMFENMQKSGRVYDFSAHTELIKRRTPAFIGLWLLISIFTLISICPLFWVIGGIFAIYFALVFQAFTFEPELSPLGCFKKSFSLIKGRFAGTFLLLALSGALTYILLPQIFVKIFALCSINKFAATALSPAFHYVQDFDFAKWGITNATAENFALLTVEAFIAQIIIQFTLPLRSIFCSLWYKERASLNTDSHSAGKKSKKRPSEKLMNATSKKYSKTKIDSNILRRAMEKDDDE